MMVENIFYGDALVLNKTTEPIRHRSWHEALYTYLNGPYLFWLKFKRKLE
jgi:hypothetical protein